MNGFDCTKRSSIKDETVAAHEYIDVNNSSNCIYLAVILAQHPKYRVHASIEPSWHELFPMNTVVDSGTGFKVGSSDVIHRMGGT